MLSAVKKQAGGAYKEAGALVTDFAGEPFVEMNPEPYLIAAHPDYLGELVSLVEQGIQAEPQ